MNMLQAKMLAAGWPSGTLPACLRRQHCFEAGIEGREAGMLNKSEGES